MARAQQGDEVARRRLQDLLIGAAPASLDEYPDPGMPDIVEMEDLPALEGGQTAIEGIGGPPAVQGARTLRALPGLQTDASG